MIKTEENPELLNKFLEYCLTYQRKSPNSVDQYNCDLNRFLRYMKYHFHMAQSDLLNEIPIKDVDKDFLSKITQDDIHAFITYLSIDCRCGPATCARKISTIRISSNKLLV